MSGFGLERDGKRTGEEKKADENEASLREHVEETIGDVAGEDGGRIGTAAEADSEAHSVAAENGREKECGEESTGITLGAGGEIELRAGGVDDHAPFGDADKMGQEVANENGEKACDGDTMNGFKKQREWQEMNEQAEDEECSEPSERDGEASAGSVFRVVGANHSC